MYKVIHVVGDPQKIAKEFEEKLNGLQKERYYLVTGTFKMGLNFAYCLVYKV